ncbi:hypothetical protein RHA1_ro07120 [Rhodococcus jostii RHA1]|uniref:Uncharacterized protein n=1 Tax=Rhodococcus jostii (strain RHA1) TaxID=101510 RepID=Q0S0Q2_RHOJR|nr:hypothetical protein RHA1_ro07120 [Rhodococcus jostii RHA1]
MPGRNTDLTDAQSALLDRWFGQWQVLADHSWPLQDTTVLRVRKADNDFIVKASRSSHHIGREIAAHQVFLRNTGLGCRAWCMPTWARSCW